MYNLYVLQNWARIALLQDHLEERKSSKVMAMNQVERDREKNQKGHGHEQGRKR